MASLNRGNQLCGTDTIRGFYGYWRLDYEINTEIATNEFRS